MATPPDLSPLELQRTGDHLRFVLKEQADILPELPADYEQLLARRLSDILAAREPLTVEIDLTGVTAVSSRQLGSLIALHKVLRPRFGRIPVHGLSGSVRHVLELTRTDTLFDLS